jgi:hypothetical protein
MGSDVPRRGYHRNSAVFQLLAPLADTNPTPAGRPDAGTATLLLVATGFGIVGARRGRKMHSR